ncbi:MAG: dTMP kinase [Candidatus Omnitrophota bacterium]
MEKKTVKGVFITFEGSECCGKSTQSRALYRHLVEKGYRVVFLREPGGTPISEMIRKILLDPANKSMAASTELLLYMASRAQTVKDVIKPALARGAIVLCDRFLDSTVVYQGYGLGMDVSFIRTLGAFATGGIRPDLTLLLDLPLKEALDNIGAKKDRIEQRNFAYHSRVKNGYLSEARAEPRRVKVVKVEVKKADTQAAIRLHVAALLKKKKYRI